MRRIDRYILGQIFWWTVFVSICLICIVWLSQSLQFVEMIVNRGLSVPMFIYFTALLLPTFLSMILPIALLFAVLFTYNKLTVDFPGVAKVLVSLGIHEFAGNVTADLVRAPNLQKFLLFCVRGIAI